MRSDYKLVKTDDENHTCKGIIIASGSLPKKLGVPGEETFAHRGVFYCATCDGPQFAGKAVAVAGAGDSGITEGLALARIATKVTIVEFLPQPKASKVLQERALSNPKIEIRCATKIEAIIGDERVTVLILRTATRARKAVWRRRGFWFASVCCRIRNS